MVNLCTSRLDEWSKGDWQATRYSIPSIIGLNGMTVWYWYIYILYIGVTYQNDMMYDNVWHDIVWEGGGGPETFKNHPTPSGTRNREELERCLKRSPFTLGLTKKMTTSSSFMVVPKLIEGKTHSGSLWSSGFFSTSVGKPENPWWSSKAFRRIAHRENLK